MSADTAAAMLKTNFLMSSSLDVPFALRRTSRPPAYQAKPQFCGELIHRSFTSGSVLHPDAVQQEKRAAQDAAQVTRSGLLSKARIV
jgi:hypothetical protein